MSEIRYIFHDEHHLGYANINLCIKHKQDRIVLHNHFTEYTYLCIYNFNKLCSFLESNIC